MYCTHRKDMIDYCIAQGAAVATVDAVRIIFLYHKFLQDLLHVLSMNRWDGQHCSMQYMMEI